MIYHKKQHVKEEIDFHKGESRRVFLGGYSQGCAVTLATALTNPDLKLGGIIGLGGFDYTGYGHRDWELARKLDSPMLFFYAEGDYSHPPMRQGCELMKKNGIKFELEIDSPGTVHYPPTQASFDRFKVFL